MSADDRRETIEVAATQVFAERGYHGASIDEIARRSGVTPPVVYDHFASKQQLYERLLERHYAALRGIWFRYAEGAESIASWIPVAVDDWFAHVEANPFAGRMLFRDTTGDPAIAAMHAEVQRMSRAQLLPLVEREIERREARRCRRDGAARGRHCARCSKDWRCGGTSVRTSRVSRSSRRR